ncbi:hypothetical protein Aperf_G00000021192 [Anoplocephala perfoliata]
MARQGGCLNFLVFGVFAALLLGYMQAEKPDTMRILMRHNQYRGLLQAADMIILTWNTSLEKVAASVVDKCLLSVSSIRSLPQLHNLGANLGTAPYPTPNNQNGYPDDIQTSIIDQWGSERSAHIPEGGCPTQPCDSWWQMVWSNVSQIGCSLKVCGNNTAMVCIYNSRANTGIDHPFKPGERCTACPIGFRKCENVSQALMCAAETGIPVEPDLPPEYQERNDSHYNKNGSGLPQPYAGSSGGSGGSGGSGDSGYVEERKVPDSSSRLTVLFTTSACLLLLGILA